MLFIFFFFFVLDLEFSVSDVSGCYSLMQETYTDRICLYSNRTYAQFFAKKGAKLKKYNSGVWRASPSSRDLSTKNSKKFFIDADVFNFIGRDRDGLIEKYDRPANARSITPLFIFKDIFGEVLFTTNPDANLYYYREEKNVKYKEQDNK